MIDKSVIYLDHAAATPVDAVVLGEMLPFFSDNFYNPSSLYSCGVKVKRQYTEAKSKIASFLGAKTEELVMTAGATESINMAFHASGGQNLTTAIEHAAVLETANATRPAIIVQPDQKGLIHPEQVQKCLTPDVDFVSIGLVNAELGVIQPIEEIAQIINQERQRRQKCHETRPLIFHSDASQAAALLDIKVKRLGVDLLTLSAAKIYGPKQVGLLWVSPSVRVQPTITGGGQELGLRSGTENVAGVIGFAMAMELAASRRNQEIKRLRSLRDQMQKALQNAFPEMIVSSHTKKSLVNFLHIAFPKIDAERLVFLLESKGVMVSTGSACAANKNRRSHILQAIGLSNEEIDGSLRISLGRLSNEQNCQKATQLIIEAVESEKARLNL